MYLGLFKIQILNRGRIGYQLQTPKVIARGQNCTRFLHFITLKQTNQKIKAPGKHITVDKVKRFELQKSRELSGMPTGKS